MKRRDARKPKRKKLPTTFGGTPVVRGKGMRYDTLDKLVDECAFADDEWPRGEFFVVTSNQKDESDLCDGKVFGKLADATTYARACGNGTVDQRVLRCTSSLLVIATMNEL